MHPESNKMYNTIRPFYYWPRMKIEIAEYVSRCSICQQVKAERKKPFGLLQPLPIRQSKWEDITMDFVYKLPYRLAKSVHFLPVHENYLLKRLVELFISEIVKYHVIPHKRLPLIEFTYSNSFHSSIGMSPFEALYGKPCRTLLCWSEVDEKVLVGPEIMDEMTQNIQVIKANLKATQDRQKSIADTHSTDKIIERVGEIAYRLDLPPELSRVHNVFHVSMLRRYVFDPSYVIPPQLLEISLYLTYDEVPVTILDLKDKVLRNKTVRIVKVL
ncbi:unnamed protein product [Malus baccata var. baccata]